jgi:hypothetical protein
MRRLLAVLLLIAPVAAQEPSFRSGSSELVVLPVVVSDREGRYVSDVARERFAVYDNGRPVPIELFSNQDTPVTIGLILDASSSMRPKLAEVLTASLAFARSSNPDDELFALRFNDDVRDAVTGHRFLRADDLVALEIALGSVRPDGRTALYDALVAGIDRLAEGSRPRKVLIVVSDGGDNASAATLDRVRAGAQLKRRDLHHRPVRGRGSRPQSGSAEVAREHHRRRTIPAPVARRIAEGVRADRARDSQRLHHRLHPARPRWCVPPRASRYSASRPAHGSYTSRLFRGWTRCAAMTWQSQSWLRWIERGLLASGLGLAAWCAVILVEERFYNSLQVPVGEPLISSDRARGASGRLGRCWRGRERNQDAAACLADHGAEGSDDATLSRGSGT